MSRRPDPIIEEIHEARREIAKRFGGDVHGISKDARERQRIEGRPMWRSEPDRPAAQRTEAPAPRE